MNNKLISEPVLFTIFVYQMHKSTVVSLNLSKFLSFLYSGIEILRVTKVVLLSFFIELFNTKIYLIDNLLVILGNEFLKTLETKPVKHKDLFS